MAFWLFVRDRADHGAGRKLYVEHCASCHGETLQGQPDWQTPKENGRLPAPPHDATGHTWHHSDAKLFGITKYGMSAVVPGHESDMPGFGPILTDEQIGANPVDKPRIRTTRTCARTSNPSTMIGTRSADSH
ncbi:c-type cytochrome [Afipia birgiae]|uniref:c-type cytochrome n=1 Tax=Afipia birgiae TaxID=151414 RepID=UPI003221C936